MMRERLLAMLERAPAYLFKDQFFLDTLDEAGVQLDRDFRVRATAIRKAKQNEGKPSGDGDKGSVDGGTSVRS